MGSLDLVQLRRLVRKLYFELDERGWFQQHLGKDCVDAPVDIGAHVLEELGRDLWPFSRTIDDAEEEWLFSIVEFLYVHAAKPTDTFNHSWSGCGLHVRDADDDAGRAEFLARANSLLARYSPPYELQENGEIWGITPAGLSEIVPERTGESTIDDRVASAQRTFLRYGATEDDKRIAVRDLADVLENLRATVGTRLPSKDEGELFAIANQFAIRHHRPDQKTDYDSGIWLDWIYFAYLNAIQLATRIINRGTNDEI